MLKQTYNLQAPLTIISNDATNEMPLLCYGTFSHQVVAHSFFKNLFSLVNLINHILISVMICWPNKHTNIF